MPNIPGLDAGDVKTNLGFQPTEIGVESVAAAARRGGTFYREAAGEIAQLGHQAGSALASAGDAYVRYQDHQEISVGAAHGAELFDSLQQSKDAAIKSIDPNDPAYGTKAEIALKQWREEQLGPRLEKFREGFTTENSQKWAERFIDQTRQHMFVQSSADIATAARIGINNSITTFRNTSSNTAINDPSSVPMLLDQADHAVTGLVGSSPLRGAASAEVRTEVLEKTKEQIVKSGAFGAIYKSSNPEATADEWIKQYPQYINGAEAKQLAQSAKAQAKTNFLQNKAIEEYKQKQENRSVDIGTNKAFTDNVTFDATTGRAIINPKYFQDVLQVAKDHPNATNAADTAKAYLAWGESQQRARAEPVISQPATKSELWTRFSDPDKPLTNLDVIKAEGEEKISIRDGSLLKQAIAERDAAPKDPTFHSAIEAAKERVGQTLVADGHERFANFMATFWPEYTKLKNAGTLPPNALDLRDPSSLISQKIKQFEPDPATKMQMHIMKSLGVTNLPSTRTPEAPAISALPPVADRVKDTVYQTARGPMKWTGTGWVNP